jgi:RNA polymerase sigma-70 factor, ECF subfamily
MVEKFETSHEELMAQFQEKCESCVFERIFSLYLSLSLAVAQQILSDRVLAEDAVQEAFLRVVRKRNQYDPSKPFASWFYTIVRNVCKDLLRRRSRYSKAIDEISKKGASATILSEPVERLELLDSLPRNQRDVLYLRMVHDLGFGDIAAALGITKEAAKKRGQRGLRQLREKFQRSQTARDEPAEIPMTFRTLLRDNFFILSPNP